MCKNLSSFILNLYGMTIIYTCYMYVNYKSATFVSQLTPTTICAQSYKDPLAIIILHTQPVFIFHIILFLRVACVIVTLSIRTLQ